MVFENAGDVGVDLAAFVVAQEGATVFGAEDEVYNDVGEGLRHVCDALSGLAGFMRRIDPGLRSSDSLQPGLSHGGLSALRLCVEHVGA